MHRLVAETLRLTLVLLAASILLIGAGALGFGGTLALAGAFAALGVAGLALRGSLGAVGAVRGWTLGWYLEVIPLGPLVAAGVVALYTGTTPPELEVLGALVGLVAMLNYFLRPIYGLVLRTGSGLANRLSA